MIDRRPAVIAQCERVEDVAAAIRFGRRTGLPIGVRGGGHSVAGKALADGGMMIDLRRMHRVTVDPEARTATVAGGATVRHLDRATEPYGLATTGGNFGVATLFTFRLHPLPVVTAALLVWDRERGQRWCAPTATSWRERPTRSAAARSS